MGIISVDGNLLKKMIIAGSNELDKNKNLLNELNVFPVPDGDTGTNMSLTVLAAAKEANKFNTPNIFDVSKATASGALRGARGNSGVIVSQLYRGFSNGFKDVSVANANDFARAFVMSKETAYKAVMKPKEGTILTVASAVADKAVKVAKETNSIQILLEEVIEEGNKMLAKTTDMLEALKQADVVDSGAKGYMCILEGMLYGLLNPDKVELKEASQLKGVVMEYDSTMNPEDIEFGYCTEFFIMVDKVSEAVDNTLKDGLSKLGDSIVVVSDEDIIKIHVHTNQPGKAIQLAMQYGALDNIKIDNMRVQHNNNINFTKEDSKKFVEAPQKEIGVVAICAGSGIADIFKNIGVDVVIEGGQSMNPSTDDILQAINEVNAKKVIVLPNNKNIILSAEQAVKLTDDKEVYLIPTVTIPEGITAMINFNDTVDIEETIELMNNARNSIKSAQVTFAVRDTVIDELEIKEGDFLFMEGKDIKHTSQDIVDGTVKLIENMLDDGEGFVSLYYGSDVTEEQAEEVRSILEDKYEDVEVDVQKGNQPLYYFIISVE